MSSLLPLKPTVALVRDRGLSPFLVELDDDDVNEVLSALSSVTTRWLLAAVCDDPRPASELTGVLDTILQAVGYHVEWLIDAELIEPVMMWALAQGREMIVYGPTRSAVALFAGAEWTESELSSGFRTLVVGVGVTLVGNAAVQTLWIARQSQVRYAAPAPTGPTPEPGVAELIPALLVGPGALVFLVGVALATLVGLGVAWTQRRAWATHRWKWPRRVGVGVHRRTLLAAAGTDLVMAPTGRIASVGDGTDDADGGNSTTESTPDPTPESVDTVSVASDKRLTTAVGGGPVGDGGALRPHHARLENPVDKSWTARIDVSRPLDADHAETCELDANATVNAPPRILATYEATVTDIDSDVIAIESVVPDDFDYNRLWTTFSPSDDDVSVPGGSTRMVCGFHVVDADDAITIAFGDGSLPIETMKPYGLAVANPTDMAEVVEFAYEAPVGAVTFSDAYHLEPGAQAGASLAEVCEVALRAARRDESGEGTTEAAIIDKSQFDCNASDTTVSLTDDGDFEAWTFSTLLFCGDAKRKDESSAEGIGRQPDL